MAALNKGDYFSPVSFWDNGPAPGSFYHFPGRLPQSDTSGSQRSQAPITTNTSVLGLKFKGGVAIVADMLGSYGSLARFRNCPRVLKVNDNIILGAGGDYADFQHLKEIIKQKIVEEENLDDGFALKPKALYCWLTRVMYNRRTKMDPLWNNYVVAGIQDGEPFLGTVDKIGTAYVDSHVATGYGGYLALPIMRDALEKNPDMTTDEAKRLLVRCLQILYYRDARSYPKYQIATLTAEGVSLEGPYGIESNWDMANMVRGYE